MCLGKLGEKVLVMLAITYNFFQLWHKMPKFADWIQSLNHGK